LAQFASLFQLKKERHQAEEEGLFLGFVVGDEAYAVEVGLIKEILKIPRIYSLPKVPSFVKGVIDLRGAILPLMDLKERLGLGPVDLKRGRVVVMIPGNKPIGLLVDTVVEVFRTDLKEIKPPPDMFRQPHLKFIRGMVRVGEQLYLIMNPRELLTPQEFSTLESHAWSSPG
jgi:purine-binding chemotaxis protein CheW